MLIAATDKGICAIQFADSDDELIHGLKHEFLSLRAAATTRPCGHGEMICSGKCAGKN